RSVRDACASRRAGDWPDADRASPFISLQECDLRAVRGEVPETDSRWINIEPEDLRLSAFPRVKSGEHDLILLLLAHDARGCSNSRTAETGIAPSRGPCPSFRFHSRRAGIATDG